ncbi:MAG: protein required for attachment to host cells [Janthinobacterium sp.]|jgi:protein required for attachment to host cells
MDTTWIIVADSSRARVFEQQEHDKHLHEIEDMVNPGARSAGLRKDDDGKLHDKSEPSRGHVVLPPTSLPSHENDVFARSIGQYLDQGRNAHRYDRLRLIAAPKFLGLIRGNLNKEVQKMVEQELPKDISMLSLHQIETYIREQADAH